MAFPILRVDALGWRSRRLPDDVAQPCLVMQDGVAVQVRPVLRSHP
jgi:hypothetical protein